MLEIKLRRSLWSIILCIQHQSPTTGTIEISSNWIIIGSGNGVSHVQRQAIT